MRVPCPTLPTLLLAAWLALMAAPLDARELATPAEDLVEVELASVGMSRLTGSPVVLLREMVSGDVVPIFIGVPEARAILMAMHDTPVPRPMTHDLMRDLLGALDAVLERVYVDDLAGGTYYGMLELRVTGQDSPLRVDTRPSDALALAVRTGARILVAPQILVAGRDLEYEGLPDEQVVTALGITVVTVTPSLRETLELPERPGLLVNRTAGLAAEAGLDPGALLLEINGETPTSPMGFLERVRATPSGERVELRYWQNGQEHTLHLPVDAGRQVDEAEDQGGEIRT